MKICSVEGCNGKHKAKGFCKKHYQQMLRKGYIYDTTEKEKTNPIEIYETYAKIIIKDKEVLIDIDDIEKIQQCKWRISSTGYVRNDNKGRLHRYIMNCPDDMVVDHINGNKLDNRKCNLRICTVQQNNMNKKSKNKNNLPRGVEKDKNRYKAYITYNHKRIYLGSYKTIEEASEAYNNKAYELYGEYAYKESQELAKINDIDKED